MDVEQALETIAARLNHHSLAHSRRTADTAREIARVSGVDLELAWLAGLLHDWARDMPASALVAYAMREGMELLPEERDHPYLLHGRVAVHQIAEQSLGVHPAVLRAIEAHTYGLAPMSDLDKVVFVADKCEPGRDFPGVEAIRTAADQGSLDHAFRLAYANSVRQVLRRGGTLHPVSAAVIAQIEHDTEQPLDIAVG